MPQFILMSKPGETRIVQRDRPETPTEHSFKSLQALDFVEISRVDADSWQDAKTAFYL